MVFPDQFLQALVGDMGINLRGADVRMAEQHLYYAQVCAVVDQMGGKGVAQAVRAKRTDTCRPADAKCRFFSD